MGIVPPFDFEQKFFRNLVLDLGRPATFDEFARSVALELERVWKRSTFDYLFNNGGVGGGMPFAQMTEEYFDKMLTTNFKGPFFLTQRLVRWIEDGGRIVNTSSNASRGSSVGYSAYGTSKAAVTSWTRYLANELAPRRIRVNAVSPGPVRTNLGDGAFDKHPEYIKPLADQTALGRIGEPEDLAKVITNLLSDDFGWVTAQDIEVSGGSCCNRRGPNATAERGGWIPRAAYCVRHVFHRSGNEVRQQQCHWQNSV